MRKLNVKDLKSLIIFMISFVVTITILTVVTGQSINMKVMITMLVVSSIGWLVGCSLRK